MPPTEVKWRLTLRRNIKRSMRKKSAAAAAAAQRRAVSLDDSSRSVREPLSNSIVHDSPYEKGYSAEAGEPLFEKANEFFESLQDVDILSTSHAKQFQVAKNRLSVFKKFGALVDDAFVPVVYPARETVRESTVLWDENWRDMRFGSYGSGCVAPRTVQEELLIMFIRPERFSAATATEMHDFYLNREILPKFKDALKVLDANKRFPHLRKSPGALRKKGIISLRRIFFIVRVYLFGKRPNNQFADLELDLGERLLGKCTDCLQQLENDVISSKRPTKARPVPVRATIPSVRLCRKPTPPPCQPEQNVARMPDKGDEDDDDDDGGGNIDLEDEPSVRRTRWVSYDSDSDSDKKPAAKVVSPMPTKRNPGSSSIHKEFAIRKDRVKKDQNKKRSHSALIDVAEDAAGIDATDAEEVDEDEDEDEDEDDEEFDRIIAMFDEIRSYVVAQKKKSTRKKAKVKAFFQQQAKSFSGFCS